MRTDQQYENFVLELEYKHLVPGGNRGAVRLERAGHRAGVPFTKSVEVQILDGSNSETHTSHGDVFHPRATSSPTGPTPRPCAASPANAAQRPPANGTTTASRATTAC